MPALTFGPLRKSRQAVATLDAIGKTQAIIEFDLDGTILHANQNFLSVMGYTASEIVGRHHRIFLDPADHDSPGYLEFWAGLARGEHHLAQFRRLAKGGRDVWIEASYNPVRDRHGKPFKVVKIATDVTRRKLEAADMLAQVAAIHKSQAVIEFDLDGTILTANQPFLDAMGYTLDEIQGRHHRMFVDPAESATPGYEAFWQRLRAGAFQAAQFRRIARSGAEVWIEASYNPVLDLDGKPRKIVKYATDITRQVVLLARLKDVIDRNFGEIDHAIERSAAQATQAVSSVDETSTGVQVMAASAEQLASSVREIADTMTRSREATDLVHAETSAAGNATARLDVASKSMQGIVDLIRNIAGQIDLLALNATIEAARAGDAGRGFAVVAGEVKNLAAEARGATDQISREIASLRHVSEEVVTALGVIKTSIDTVRDFVAGTASAVEEQSAVTQDMSANMQKAARGVFAINDNITEISAAIAQAAQAVGTTREATTVLAR